MSRPLDGQRKHPLMFGARARLASRPYLAALGQITPQNIWLLVVDPQILVRAESASLYATSVSPTTR
jgi:hypothetical protein